jgi:preprotein translocase subunit SecE
MEALKLTRIGSCKKNQTNKQTNKTTNDNKVTWPIREEHINASYICTSLVYAKATD